MTKFFFWLFQFSSSENEKRELIEDHAIAVQQKDAMHDILSETTERYRDADDNWKISERQRLALKSELRRKNEQMKALEEENVRLKTCVEREHAQKLDGDEIREKLQRLHTIEAAAAAIEQDKRNLEALVEQKDQEVILGLKKLAQLEDYAAGLSKEKMLKEDVYKREIELVKDKLRILESDRDKKLAQIRRLEDDYVIAEKQTRISAHELESLRRKVSSGRSSRFSREGYVR